MSRFLKKLEGEPRMDQEHTRPNLPIGAPPRSRSDNSLLADHHYLVCWDRMICGIGYAGLIRRAFVVGIFVHKNHDDSDRKEEHKYEFFRFLAGDGGG